MILAPSERAHTFVKSFEKLRLTAYLPTPNDKPTIGWGQTGPGIKLGMVWTKEQADAAYEAFAAKVTARLNKLLYGIPTTQGQFDALFSFAYNVGADNLATSTLLRKHKASDYAGAADQFLKWDHQAGKVLRGLTRRRQAERAIYLS
jgi:GH24 family phage-related lysozyme (muramidase)